MRFSERSTVTNSNAIKRASRDRLIRKLALWRSKPYKPPTVRLCMLEVAEAVPAQEAGQVRWLSDFVCYRLFPILKPHCFRTVVHVVPRTPMCDVADYAISLRLFHEGENG